MADVQFCIQSETEQQIFAVHFDILNNDLRIDKLTNQCYLNLQLDITNFTGYQFSALHILLFNIHQNQNVFFDQVLKIIITDNRKSLKNDKIPSMWSNIGIYCARLGFNVFANDIIQNELNEYNVYYMNKLNKYKVFNNAVHYQMSSLQDFEYCILLQIAALGLKDNPHLLPFSYAITAFYLMNNYPQNIQQTYSLSAAISASHLLFKGELPQGQQLECNILELPTHLLEFASFQQFQLLCSVSFLFKPECLSLMTTYTKFQNAVISQSSQSGKSVTLYTIWFFHLMIQKYCPIMTICQKVINIVNQPLYNIADFQISNVFFPQFFELLNKNSFTLESLQTVLKQEQESYQKNLMELSTLIKHYYIPDDDQEEEEEEYGQLEEEEQFNNMQQYVMLWMRKLITDDNILKQFKLQKWKTLSFMKHLHFQKIIDQRKSDKTSKNNKFKLPILLFDEILSAQKQIYFNNMKPLLNLTNYYYNTICEQSNVYFNNNIVENINLSDFQSITYKNLEDMIISKVNDQVQQVTQQQTKVLIFLFQNLKQLNLQVKNSQYNPNNIIYIIYKNSISYNSQQDDQQLNQNILQHFEKLLKDITDSYKKNANTIIYYLFQLLLEFNNVRALESTFIRELQFQSGIKLQKDKTNKDNYKNYVIPLSILSGTDLTVFNYIQFSELFYQTTGSRYELNFQYSQLIGACQFHPSLLTQNYYQEKKIIIQSDTDTKNAIQQSLNSYHDNQLVLFLLTITAQQYSYFQLICPLITPQILFQVNKKYVLYNGTTSIETKINGKKFVSFLFNSLIQNLNKVSISRNNKQLCVTYETGPSQLKDQQLFLGSKQEFNLHNIFNINQSSNINQQISFLLQYSLFDEICKAETLNIELLRVLLLDKQIHETSILLIYIATLFKKSNLENVMKQILTANNLHQVNLYYFPMSLQKNIYINQETLDEEIQSLFCIQQFQNHHQQLINFCANIINKNIIFKQLQFDAIIDNVNDYYNDLNRAKDLIVDDLYYHSLLQGQQCKIFLNEPFIVITIFDKRSFFEKLKLDILPTPDYIISFHNIQDHLQNEAIKPLFEMTLENKEIRYFPLEIGDHCFKKSVQKVMHATQCYGLGKTLQPYKFGVELSTHIFPFQVEKIYFNYQNEGYEESVQSATVVSDFIKKKFNYSLKLYQYDHQPFYDQSLKIFRQYYINLQDYVQFRLLVDKFQEQSQKNMELWFEIFKTKYLQYTLEIFDDKKYKYDVEYQNYFIYLYYDRQITQLLDELIFIQYYSRYFSPLIQDYGQYGFYKETYSFTIIYFSNIQDSIHFRLDNQDLVLQAFGSFVFITKIECQQWFYNWNIHLFNIRSSKQYILSENSQFNIQQQTQLLNQDEKIVFKLYDWTPCLVFDLVMFEMGSKNKQNYFLVSNNSESFQMLSSLKTIQTKDAQILVKIHSLKSKIIEQQKHYIITYNYLHNLHYIIGWANSQPQNKDTSEYLVLYQKIDLNQRNIIANLDLHLVKSSANIQCLINQIVAENSKNIELQVLYSFSIQPESITIPIFTLQTLLAQKIVILGKYNNQLYAASIKTPLELIQYWSVKNTKNHSNLVSKYILAFNSIDLTDEIVKAANLEIFAFHIAVEQQIQLIIKNAVSQANDGKIFVELYNLLTDEIIQSDLFNTNDLSVIQMINYLGKYVIFNYKLDLDYNSVKIGVILAEKYISQSNSVVEVEPVQKNIKEDNLSHLQTIKQWIVSYPPQRSPDVENYLKMFANLTEENVKNANLELFKEGMTVEKQLQLAIDDAQNIVQDGKINIFYGNKFFPNCTCQPGEIVKILVTKPVIKFDVTNVLAFICPE